MSETLPSRLLTARWARAAGRGALVKVSCARAAAALVAVALVAVLLPAAVSAQALSDVAALNNITVAGGTLSPEFSADVHGYRVGVAHDEDQATVGFTKGHSGQQVALKDGSDQDLADADTGEGGHQVDLAHGANTVKLVVTPEDTAADAATYTLTIVRALPAGVVGVPADWALKPDGLSAGDQFRLMLVTSSTRDAASTSIDDYDTFVRGTITSNGHDAIKEFARFFKALASTAAVSARDHTTTTYTDGGAEGVPIHWLNGQRVHARNPDGAEPRLVPVNNYEEFWETSDSWYMRPRYETGSRASGSQTLIWTGSASDGSRMEGATLGSTAVHTGHFDQSVLFSRPFNERQDNTLDNSREFRMLGLSGVFQVVDVLPAAGLAALSVTAAGDSDDRLHGFSIDHSVYHGGFGAGVSRATLDWTAVDEAVAAVSVLDADGGVLEDADGGQEGHQVDLEEGLNTVTVRVARTDNNLSREYTLHLGVGSTELGGWRADDDIDFLWNVDGIKPRGMTGTVDTLWVADAGSNKLLAFDRSDGSREAGRDIMLSSADGNDKLWGGIWSDMVKDGSDFTVSGTVWVADPDNDKLFAYRIDVNADGTPGTDHGGRDSGKDIKLSGGNDNPEGLWSNGSTMWVNDSRDRNLYAYHLGGTSHGERDSDKDIDVSSLFNGNERPKGIVGDGTAVWVLNDSNNRLQAFQIANKLRNQSWDIRLHDSQHQRSGSRPYSAWIEGDAIYVDRGNKASSKVFAYNTTHDTSLSSVALSGLTLTGSDSSALTLNPTFAPGVTYYETTDPYVGDKVTVAAVGSHVGAGVKVAPADADSVETGHQVAVMFDRTHIEVTATAPSGYIESYRVLVSVGEVQALNDWALKPQGLSVGDRFRTGDWNVFKSVTVAAGADAVIADEAVTLRYAASGDGYDVSGDVAVTAADDTGALVFVDAPVSVIEGRSAFYGVKLSAEPSGSVSVSVAAGGDLVLSSGWVGSVSVLSLAFTTGDWNVFKSVRVDAAADDDIADDVVTLRHVASGGGYDVSGDVVVRVEDDDIGGLMFTSGSVSVGEGAGVAYGVRLSGEPSGSVSVSVAAGGDLVLSSGWVGSVSVLSLAFTTGDWNVFKSVRVDAGSDDDIVDDVVALRHVASGGGYHASGDVEVTVEDDDIAGLEFTSPSGSVSVGEGSHTVYGVRLSAEPSGPVSVSVSTVAGSDLVLSSAGSVAVTLLAASDLVPGRAMVSGSVSVLSLAFTTGDWNVFKSVRVDAGSDDDIVDDVVALRHVASGGGYHASGDVEVTVEDDDIAGLEFTSPSGSVSVGEGSHTVYGVRLSAEPSGPVSVSVSTVAGSDLVLSSAGSVAVTLLAASDLVPGRAMVSGSGSVLSLVFAADDWDSFQSVTVLAGSDDDIVDDVVVLRHMASGGGFDVSGDVEVTVEDDDIGGLMFTSGSVSVGEGAGVAYGVRLSGEPSGSVSVSVAAGGDLVLSSGLVGSVSVLSLAFTTGDWNVFKSVRVDAGSDDDIVDDVVALRHVASGGGYHASGDVEVTVEDDDIAGLEFTSPSGSVSVGEGSHTVYGVRLSAEPLGPVSVSVSTVAGSDLVLSSAGSVAVTLLAASDLVPGRAMVSGSGSVLSLVFSVGDWDSFQSVTVLAGSDDDIVDDVVVLRHTASGGGFDVSGDVEVTVEDDDTAGLVFDAGSVSVVEGAGVEYGVRLSAEPSGSVSVSVSAGAGSDLVLSAATAGSGSVLSLVFAVGDWDSFQSVTVLAGSDDDIVDDVVVLRHVASGGGFDVSGDVEVTVEDDDTAGLVFDAGSVSMVEGSHAVYGVRLSAEPSGSVSVSVSAVAGSDLVLSAATAGSGSVLSLVFAVGDWDSFQSVTVLAGSDDDIVDDVVVLRHVASGGGFDVSGDVEVTVEDDDTAGLVFDAGSVSVVEGAGVEYGVRLSGEPSGSVSVSLSAVDGAGGDLVLSAATAGSGSVLSLVFAVGDWDSFQSVTVLAGSDDDIVDDVVVLRHVASGGGFDVSGDVEVTVEDDDTAGLVFDAGSVSVGEGAGVEYGVRLSAEPSGSVSVSVSAVAGSDLVLSAATAGSGSVLSLVFAVGDWDSFQSVTVLAGGDDDIVDDVVVLRHVASGGGFDVSGDVEVTVEDDDTAGLVFDAGSMSMGEGSHAVYGVRLSAEPSGSVSVSVSAVDGAGGDLVLSAATAGSGSVLSLVFAVGDWDSFQSVTVLAGGDDDIVDDVVTLRHMASGGGFDVSGDVEVTVEDDDTAGLVFDAGSVSVVEGAGVEYGVRLSGEPSGSVSVSLSAVDGAGGDLVLSAATAGSGSVLSLVFSVGDWDSFQSVTVLAGSDDDIVDDVVVLRHVASGGGFDVSGDVEVTVEDDDTAGLVFDAGSVSVVEGAGVEYGVRLSGEPSGSVSVSLSAVDGAGGDLVLSAATAGSGSVLSLVFSVGDWDSFQSVTVLAGSDDDIVDDVVTLRHVASGGGFDVSGDVEVRVEDDDTAGLVFDAGSVSVVEGAGVEYGVRLSGEPSGSVSVSVSAVDGAGGDLVLSAATAGSGSVLSLVFAVGDWDSFQSVTVLAGSDDDIVDDVVVLRHVASGGGFDVSGDVEVTVEDDDTAGLVFDAGSVSVVEGAGVEYGVRLSGEPSGSVSVSVSTVAGSDLVLSAATAGSGSVLSLVFAVGDWDSFQSVTVLAGSDDDIVDDVVVLRHVASGGGFDVSGDVEVTVEDDDTAGLVFDAGSVSVVEGAGVEYGVRLSGEPSGSVSVSVSAVDGAGGDLVLSAATAGSGSVLSLVFAVGDWDSFQSVTVLAGGDDDIVDDVVTLRHVASGGGFDVSGDVEVTVEDDDTAGLVFDAGSVSVVEGAGVEYGVRLSGEPSGSVSVSVSAVDGAGGDLVLSAATAGSGSVLSLVFAVGDWDSFQSVTVLAGGDDDIVDDVVTLRHVASGGGFDVSGDVEVTVEDDDTAGLVFDAGSVSVVEGAGVEYGVRLSAEPSGSVSVSVSAVDGAGGDLVLSAATAGSGSVLSLVFAVGDWDSFQSVTVLAGGDDDIVDDVVVLRHVASGGGFDVSGDVEVTVEDDDTAGLVFDAGSVSVVEGAGVEYGVRLSGEPSGSVSVSVSAVDGAGGDLVLSAATAGSGSVLSLVFAVGDWDSFQSVTVLAGGDDDIVDDVVTLRHVASGGGFDVSGDVEVTVEDDDTAGLVFDAGSVSVVEGAGVEYGVRLSGEPSGSVSVSVSAVDGAGGDLVLSAATAGSGSVLSLVFAVGDWDSFQSVTVLAGGDDDIVDDVVTLRHVASGGGFDVSGDVEVTVEDDDTAGLVFDAGSMSMGEGSHAVYGVRLSGEPSGSVSVSVSAVDGAGGDLVLSAATAGSGSVLSLVFAVGDWDSFQSVTVLAGGDDDIVDDVVTLRHVASGGGFDVSGDVEVTVEDDDTAGLVFDAGSVSVVEGAGVEYGVRLSAEPSGSVSVSLSTVAGSDLVLSAATAGSGSVLSLVFAVGDWDSFQSVTVLAGGDDDIVDDVVTLRHVASGGGFDVSGDVEVTVEDDDTAGLVFDAGSVSVVEGAGVEYGVRLSAEPSGSVSVSLSTVAGSDLVLSAATAGSGSVLSLVFAVGDWDSFQSVTVLAGGDDDIVDDVVTLRHVASGGGFDVSGDVEVTVEDDDTAGLVFDAGSVSVVEGAGVEYGVRLSAEPSGSVSVSLSTVAGSDLVLSAATAGSGSVLSLVFAVGDWDSFQSVTVLAGGDDDIVDDVVTLRHVASGGGFDVSGDVEVTVEDDDTAGLVFDAGSVSVVEGSHAVYGVRLSGEPSGSVSVSLSAVDGAGGDLVLSAATAGSGSVLSLVFSVGDWDSFQSVTVLAGSDDDIVDDVVTLRHVASGGGFDVSGDVEVTVEDDDTAGLVFDAGSVSVVEGAGVEYGVRLSAEPSGSVSVSLSTVAGSDLVLSAATAGSGSVLSLVFAVGDWDSFQSVTVLAGGDDDIVDDVVTLRHVASGGGFDVSGDVEVTVEDDDTAGLVFDAGSVSVVEGAGVEYGVRLSGEPSGSVSVSVSAVDGAGGDLVLSAATAGSGSVLSLVFAVGDWDSFQSVTVLAGGDDDIVDDVVTLRHVASGGGFDVSGDVEVTVEDDDTAGLVFDAGSVSVVEGSHAVYGVRLSGEPSGSVSVSLSAVDGAGGDLVLSAATAGSGSVLSLVFSVGDWDSFQSVTVLAGSDDDIVDDVVTLRHMASGGGFDVSGDVEVTVEDDDTAGLVFDTGSVSVVEGAGVEYGVRLSAEPSGSVSVSVSAGAGSDLVLSAATAGSGSVLSLVFAVGDWDSFQSVTVLAGSDDDIVDDVVVLRHVASGGGFDVSGDVEVTVEDDDTAGLVFDAGSVSVVEGAGVEYGVRLSAEPSGSVSVSVSAVDGAGGDLVLSAATAGSGSVLSLVFAVGDWDSFQSVTVLAGSDDDIVDDVVVLRHVASGGGFDVSGDVEVTVEDDDTAGLVFDAGSVSVVEGAGVEYGVRLSAEPSGSVSVSVSAVDGAGGDLVLSAATAGSGSVLSLVFAVGDWDSFQSVTVLAGSDDDIVDDVVVLRHVASGGGFDVSGDVEVTVEDDDTAGLVFDAGSVSVVEGAGVEYGVRLSAEPSGSVSVSVSAVAGSDLVLSAATAGSGSVLSLVFAVGDWDSFQSVTVLAGSDDDIVDDVVVLRHVASGGGFDVSGDVEVTVEDDDTAGLVFDAGSMSMVEGSHAVYGVRLSAEPSGSVSVSVSAVAGSDLVLSAATAGSGSVLSLVFAVGDWDSFQSVTVLAGSDDDIVDDVVTLRHMASGGGFNVSGDVEVTVEDDDTAGLVFDAGSVSVGEGSHAVYGVRLSGEPSGSVSVSVSAVDGAGSYLVLVSGSRSVLSLVFAAGDWDSFQSVTVYAAGDADIVDDVVTLRHVASGGGFDVSGDVEVTVEDDDTAGLVFDAGSMSMVEGSHAVYGVRLSGEPSGSVSVSLSAVDGAGDDLVLSAATAGSGSVLSLVFAVGDWDSFQSVTVHAGGDADIVDDVVTLRHVASGGGFDVSGDMVVTVEDDDTAPPSPPPPPPPPSSSPLLPPEGPSSSQFEGFADMDTNSVHMPAIATMFHSGITRGCDTDPPRFCPKQSVTRAQMASLMSRALGLDDAPQPAGFVDVDPDSPHAAAIDALHYAGITMGCDTDPLRYCPDLPVTRAQMAGLLHRALGSTGAPRSAGFVDVDPDSPHAAAIDALHYAGITMGCDTDPLRYCPHQHVTRAQMASLLRRALDATA